jgi:alkane 1-monooxygenase
VFGSLLSSWEIEKNRIMKKEKKTHAFSIKNQMIWYLSGNALMIYVFYLGFGFKGMIYFLITAFISVFLLEIINYVEHYGL